MLQRDAAHQPSPKTDALVDQLLTGVVGNQLKEAPGECGRVTAVPTLCCLLTWLIPITLRLLSLKATGGSR